MSTVGSAEFGAFLAGRFGDHADPSAALATRARAAFGDHGFAALLTPPTPDAVAEALALCSAEGWPVLPLGAATWPHPPAGAPPSRPPVLLSTARLDGITEHEPADLVIGVQAGLPLHRLDQALRASRQWLPLDPPAANGATIGAAAALSAAGPLRAGHGTPRDMALGIELATGDGRLIRFGGRVVKNVAGYDGVRLTIGSRGTLGIITGMFLRVRGTPRADRTVALPCGAGDDGFRRGADLAAAIRGSVTCDALELISPAVAGRLGRTAAPKGWTLLVRVLGGAAAVEDGLDRVRAVTAGYTIGGQAQKVADVPGAIWDALSQLEADAACALRLTGPGTLLADGIAVATTATHSRSVTGTDGGSGGWLIAAHAADGVIRMWRPAAEPRSGTDGADCADRIARATANSEWTMRMRTVSTTGGRCGWVKTEHGGPGPHSVRPAADSFRPRRHPERWDGGLVNTEAIGGPIDELRREEAGLLACVHCGFCLNACPTYTRLGHEADSPRGRLDLMRAVMEGRLEPDDEAFRTHIDQCLGCRACEPVCPSGVPYGFLLERARSAIAQSAGVPVSTRLLIAAYTGPLRSLVTLASRAIRSAGFAGLLARIAPKRFATVRFGLAMLASSAPSPGLLRRGWSGGRATVVPSPSTVPYGRSESGADVGPDGERAFADPHGLMGAYPDATAVTREDAGDGPGGRTRVALLTGCVQESLFSRVNRATERVLAANGCDVVDVRSQQCCGALDAHAGQLERARELARINIAAFERSGAEVVVVNAAGCGAMMKEYGEQLRHDAEWAGRAESFVKKVRDVSEFLADRPLKRGGAVALRVTYDAPCHLHHGQRIRDAPLRVLDSVPQLERVPLADADECCGGAGLYGVHHPDLGGRILRDKVAAIRGTGADAVLTPNPGCMMQIGAGMLLEGMTTAVLHPVEILDESYRRAAEETGT